MGRGIDPSPLNIDQTVFFRVMPKDRYGNNLTAWDEDLTVTIQTLVNSVDQDLTSPLIYAPTDISRRVENYPDASGLSAYLTQFPDAPRSPTPVDNPAVSVKQIETAYTPQVAGQYFVSVLVNNKHLPESPYRVTVQPGKVGVALSAAYVTHPNFCRPVLPSMPACTQVEGQGLTLALKPASAAGRAVFDIVVRYVCSWFFSDAH